MKTVFKEIKMNLKYEFIEHIEQKNVLCARIDHEVNYLNPVERYILKTGYTKEDWARFLNEINFIYDNDFGHQYITGTIWYTDGTWSDRAEYDGSEWWEHRERPQVPDYLQN